MRDCAELEREAQRQLPGIVAELLGKPVDRVAAEPPADRAADLELRTERSAWRIEVKLSSGSGVIDQVARRFDAAATSDRERLLVVPFMTPAGAQAAAARGLNWIDLSGNAHWRTPDMYVHVEGRPNRFAKRGPTASPFAPKSSRIAHVLLLDPSSWWRQVELAARVSLDDGYVSRVIRRLDDEQLLERDGSRFRPRDPNLLLDAWIDDYRFDRHDLVLGHVTGSGIELARTLSTRLEEASIEHAFTGLTAAWLQTRFARFRLNTVYVHGDPRNAADAVGLRRNERGANVQLIGPDDQGVFLGEDRTHELPCVSPVQVYLDLQHLPERADEAAAELRDHGLWPR